MVDVGDEAVGNLIALCAILYSFYCLCPIPVFLQQFVFLFYDPQLLVDVLLLVLFLLLYSLLVGCLVLGHFKKLFLLLSFKSSLQLMDTYILQSLSSQNGQDGLHLLVEIKQLVLLYLSGRVYSCLFRLVGRRWVSLFELVSLYFDGDFGRGLCIGVL